jgi:hypothetical protein
MFRYSPRHSRGIRRFATHATKVPQTVIEKVVQKYAVGLPAGKVVKAGDYVMIRPEHVMTHDNTGPVISKYALFAVIPALPESVGRAQEYTFTDRRSVMAN